MAFTTIAARLIRDAAVTLAKLGGLTTKGDLLAHNGTDHTRLPVGSDGQVLAADSLAADGIAWATVDSSIADHGNLAGLGDDDHSQYVHTATARTVTAVHTFNPSTATAPLILGANASGQLIAGLNADQLDGNEASAFAEASHAHDTADITTGTFADARIAQTNVTQHQAAIDHDALTNFTVDEHRTINDAGVATTDLWSADKITTELAGKSDTSHTHDGRYYTETETDTLLDGRVATTGDIVTGVLEFNLGAAPTNGVLMMEGPNFPTDMVGISYTENGNNDVDLHLGWKLSFDASFQKGLTISSNTGGVTIHEGHLGVGATPESDYAIKAVGGTGLFVATSVPDGSTDLNARIIMPAADVGEEVIPIFQGGTRTGSSNNSVDFGGGSSAFASVQTQMFWTNTKDTVGFGTRAMEINHGIGIKGPDGEVRIDWNGDIVLKNYTDASRPTAGTAGRVIFNSTDGQLNVDDGTNWTLPDGTTT